MDNWETDPKTGKRFRRFGRNGIEYEMQVTTTAGTVPQSRLSETAQAEQDWRARMLRSESEERRSCPLREMRPCQADCVFYNGRICGIVSGKYQAGVCPLWSVKCGKGCAMYGEGCNLFQVKNGGI